MLSTLRQSPEHQVKPKGHVPEPRPVEPVQAFRGPADGLPARLASPSAAPEILHLQRCCGNRHVQRLIARARKDEKAGAALRLQAKLTVGAPNDEFEQEADRVAEDVMRMPEPGGRVQRLCSECEEEMQRQTEEETAEEEEEIQAKELPGHVPRIAGGLEARIGALRGGGRPLPESERAFFEPRFGADFGNVRIHTDGVAAEVARAIGAEAFTLGQEVMFGAGRFDPSSTAGRRLLAHELTHTIQQGGYLHFQRATLLPAGDALLQRQSAGRESTSPPVPCAVPAHCSADFCRPYGSVPEAREARFRLSESLLTGIAIMVSPRVVPLWWTYLWGGAAPEDFSGRFGLDFTSSATTAETTDFLLEQLRFSLSRTPPTFLPGQNVVTVDLRSRIGPALQKIGEAGGSQEMNFNYASEIPGNIAGGIGTETCRVGAQPSPFNDERTAWGTADITRDGSGGLIVIPHITYRVRDTIDLCPGDCGTGLEPIATVPLSRMEASGISGDVPFTVIFPAPPRILTIGP